MGELHLEIACNRLTEDLKAKATIGKIEIGYREAITAQSTPFLSRVDREVGGLYLKADGLAAVEPISFNESDTSLNNQSVHQVRLHDNNLLTILVPPPSPLADSASDEVEGMPAHLTRDAVYTAIQAGVTAAVARGPKYHFPIHSTHIKVHLKPEDQLFSETTSSAIALATRQAVQGAIRESQGITSTALLEPVMLATINIKEHDMGAVVHDLTSARGAQVLSLEEDDASGTATQSSFNHATEKRLDLKKVYTPPDPFQSRGGAEDLQDIHQRMRQITARVPLKEMIGYLKHLRSLTAGRGTFVMQFDRFEPVRGQRLKRAVTELRGV